MATSEHRRALLVGLRRAGEELARCGCKRLFVDGSYVTDEPIPQDYDGCWDLDGVALGELDPVLLDFTNRRAAQKAKYLGELLPAQVREGGSGKTFLEFFQQDKETGEPKGILVIDLGKDPP